MVMEWISVALAFVNCKIMSYMTYNNLELKRVSSVFFNLVVYKHLLLGAVPFYMLGIHELDKSGRFYGFFHFAHSVNIH